MTIVVARRVVDAGGSNTVNVERIAGATIGGAIGLGLACSDQEQGQA
jgi:hypothetical protein